MTAANIAKVNGVEPGDRRASLATITVPTLVIPETDIR